MKFNVHPVETDRATFPTTNLGKAMFLILAGYEPDHNSPPIDSGGRLYFRFSQDAGPFNQVYNLLYDAVMDAKSAGKPLTAREISEKADEIWCAYEAKCGGQRM